jgi:hypothetical protein
MLRFKSKLAFLGVPAVLVLGAVSYGSVVGFSSPTPSPPAATSPAATAPAEAPGAPETLEPNEPALPGGGYADADNVQADTQQSGIN